MSVLDSIKAHDANHCIAAWHDTVIAVWWGPASVQDVVGMTRIGKLFLAAERRPGHLLLIIEPTSPTPTGAVFTEFVRFTEEVASKMAISVAVSEGGGFRAASVRGVAAALAMAMPKRVPFQFTGSVEQGVAILAPHLSHASGGFRGLLQAVEDLREHSAKHQRA